jgi:hypothetical protein
MKFLVWDNMFSITLFSGLILVMSCQNFASVLQLIKEAFFKHGDEKTLKGCITALAFAANESHADLQDSANQILKETADELLVKLRSAIMRVGVMCCLTFFGDQLYWSKDLRGGQFPP